jgi:hypothetical protein
MEDTAVIPNGHIVLVPLEPHLQIMVLGDQLQEVRLDDITLALSHTIDPALLNLVSCTEERFPARDWVSADDWVRSLEC